MLWLNLGEQLTSLLKLPQIDRKENFSHNLEEKDTFKLLFLFSKYVNFVRVIVRWW